MFVYVYTHEIKKNPSKHQVVIFNSLLHSFVFLKYENKQMILINMTLKFLIVVKYT